MVSVWNGKGKLKKLHAKQNGVCPLCRQGLKLSEASLDHILPRSKGGSSSLENLRATHKVCNAERGSGSFDDIYINVNGTVALRSELLDLFKKE
jgi:hypothetical protein